MALVLSVATFVYVSDVSSSIESSSFQAISANAQIQASNAANVASDDLETVVSNVEILASTRSAQTYSADVQMALDVAQFSTPNFTSGYGLTGQNGTLLFSSNQTSLQMVRQAHLNFSRVNWFLGAKQSGSVYISPATPSILGHQPFLFISYPVYENVTLNGQVTNVFRGNIVASISTRSLGATLRSQQLVPSTFTRVFSTVPNVITMCDSNGTLLYDTSPESHTGLNIFTNWQNITSNLPADQRVGMASLLQGLIDKRVGGTVMIPYQNPQMTLAYAPIFVDTHGDGNNESDRTYFGVLWVGFNNVLPASESSQIASIGTLAAIRIGIIGAFAIGASFVFLRWNRRLDRTVKLRTLELNRSNEELRRVNEELREKHNTQRDFINTAAHELRTPIQPLLGMTEIMRQSMKEKGTKAIELSEMELELLERNAQRLGDLTKRILDLARLENKDVVLKSDRFDLNQEVKEIVEASSARSGGKINIAYFPSSEPLTVEGDKTRMGEVVSNLINNAIKYSKAHGSCVSVYTWKQANEAYVRVKDLGPGVDTDAMPRLFTKFFTKSESGIGLGLYISKLIVEAHGGRIWAENNSGGESGASFTFTVPLLAQKFQSTTEPRVALSVESDQRDCGPGTTNGVEPGRRAV